MQFLAILPKLSPDQLTPLGKPWVSSLLRGVLVNTAAFGVICFNSGNFCHIFAEFLKGQQYKKRHNSSVLLGTTFGTSSSPFDLLKDIFTEGAVSTCFLDLFEAHNLIIEATLFSFKSVHACNLNNKAAAWLHAKPSLK